MQLVKVKFGCFFV
jgi:hypothetical protein